MNCDHENVRFDSEDFYVICQNCRQFWSKVDGNIESIQDTLPYTYSNTTEQNTYSYSDWRYPTVFYNKEQKQEGGIQKVESDLKEWQAKELELCKEDVVYFIEHYIKVWHTNEPYPKHIQLSEDIKKLYREQSAQTASYPEKLLWSVLFNRHVISIGIVNNFNLLKDYYRRLPLWMRKTITMNVRHYSTELNESEVQSGLLGTLQFSSGSIVNLYNFQIIP